VRAVSRSSEVRFDWSDQGTWPNALTDATAVYLVAPPDPALAAVFVKQASSVRRFVVLSGRGIDRAPAGMFEGMAAAEQAVRDAGAEWTILRPNNFNQNFDEDLWHAPLRAGRLALPMGAIPEPFVDVQDIADVAAAVLTTDGHHGEVYDLSGPRALTFEEAVTTIATASGRPLRYEELTPAEYRAELLADGVPPEFADELNAMFATMRAGHLTTPGNGVQRVLDRAPIDFTDYAKRNAHAWVE